jgi:anti-sigma B factor antagonist
LAEAATETPFAGTDGFGLWVDLADGRAVLNVSGELDVATAPLLADCVDHMLGQGQSHLTIDLENVRFLDSQGLNVLVVAYKRAHDRDGEVVVRGAQGSVLKVLDICGLTKVLAVDEL